MGFSSGSSQSSSESNGYGYNLSSAISNNSSSQSTYQPTQNAINRNNNRAAWTAESTGVRDQTRQNINQNNQSIANLNPMATGQGPMSQWTDPNNANVQMQLGQLGTQMGNFFNEQLMPGITGSAISSGGYGGGRNQLAVGQAAGKVGEAYSQGATGIMSNAYNQAQSAAGMQSQNMMAANGMIQNLGMGNIDQYFAPMNQMAGILGGPTVLSQSQGSSRANQMSENITSAESQSSSSNFGLSFI